MAKVISLSNLKGGVGKSTLSISVASYLHNQGYNVLLLDADVQNSAMDWSNISEECPFSVLSVTTAKLHRDVNALKDKFDFIIIDSPPRLNAVVKAIFLSSDLVLIPISPSAADLWGLEAMTEIIEEVFLTNPNLKLRAVINRRIKGSKLDLEITDALKDLDLEIFHTKISSRQVYPTTFSAGQSVLSSTNKDAAIEITSLGEEVLKLFNMEACYAD